MKIAFLFFWVISFVSNSLFSQKFDDLSPKDKPYFVNVAGLVIPYEKQVYQHYYLSVGKRISPKISMMSGFSFTKGYNPILLFGASARNIKPFVGVEWHIFEGEKFIFKPFVSLGYSNIRFSGSYSGLRFNSFFAQIGFIPEFKIGNFGLGILARGSLGLGKYVSKMNYHYSQTSGNNLLFDLDGVHFGLCLSYYF